MQQQTAFYEYRYHYLEVVNDSEATETHELIISIHLCSGGIVCISCLSSLEYKRLNLIH